MAIEHLFQARAVAGRTAISLTDEHGQEIASDMIAGLLSGFLLAYSKCVGWDATIHLINEVARGARKPGEVEKPKLYCVNGRECA